MTSLLYLHDMFFFGPALIHDDYFNSRSEFFNDILNIQELVFMPKFFLLEKLQLAQIKSEVN